MATLTAQAKAELIATRPTRPRAIAAELAALVRFAGEITRDEHGAAITLQVDSHALAQRVAAAVSLVADASASISAPAQATHHKEARYDVTVSRGATEVIRRLGLVTRGGTPVVGMPPQIVSGTTVDTEAAWRGAFLAAGHLAEPSRSTALAVIAPCQEAALALVGAARRLGVTARTKESRGVVKVMVKDTEGIKVLLARMGAHLTRLEWDDQRRAHEAETPAHRLANFDDANLRRSVRAAVAAAAKVERAMEILGDDIPDHLVEAGQLRIRHRQESLEELGRLSDPPMTKDAVAGRIRRLLTMADKKAEELGLPPTSDAVNEEMLEEI